MRSPNNTNIPIHIMFWLHVIILICSLLWLPQCESAIRKKLHREDSYIDPLVDYDFSPDILTELLVELKYSQWYRQQQHPLETTWNSIDGIEEANKAVDSDVVLSEEEIEETREDIDRILRRIEKRKYWDEWDWYEWDHNLDVDYWDKSHRSLSTTASSQYSLIEIEAVTTRRPTMAPTAVPTGNVPTVEYDALYSLYLATNGENWRWNWTGTIVNRKDYFEVPEIYQNPYPGIPWNFTYENKSNPCLDSWEGIDCNCYSAMDCTIVALSLRRHGLVGFLPSAFFNLVNLTFLDLAVNNISGTIPIELYQNFTALTYLDLSMNLIQDKFQPAIQNLTQLAVLNISGNAITGTMPDEIYNMTTLQSLILSYTKIRGTISESIGQLTGLIQFAALSCNFHGSLPKSLANATNLRELNLRYNDLTSTIPDSYTTFQHLRILDGGHNRLTGTLPNFGENNRLLARNLQLLHFDSNYLTGTLPSSIGQLSSLTSLFVYYNYLHGPLPSSYSEMGKLNSLNLQLNMFTGTIPASYSNLTSIWILSFASNFFEGDPMPLATDKPKLIALITGRNQFTGTLPEYASTAIPFQFPSFPLMTVYQNNYNLFTGTFPASLEFSNLMLFLAINNNLIEGQIPPWVGGYFWLNYFSVGNNIMTGTIPEMITNQTWRTSEFIIENNKFTGTLLESIGTEWKTLTELNVQGNNFHGKVPQSLQSLKTLNTLSLADNFFSGNLEIFLTSSKNAYENIDVSGNAFTGTIPTWLFSVPTLQTFVASSNCFHGTIPEAICTSQSLVSLIMEGLSTASSCQQQLFPGIAGFNAFSNAKSMDGSIPGCIFAIPTLISLHMSGNGLQGSLDDEIFVSSSLQELSISHNVLTGTIPMAIQERPWLQLDLSYNKLRGMLSSNISSFAYNADNGNSSLFLKVNRISGGIPQHIRNMGDIQILDGNLFECDLQRTQLPPSDPATPTYSCGSDAINITIYVWIVLIFVVIVGLICLGRYELNRMAAEDAKAENQERLTEMTDMQKSMTLSSKTSFSNQDEQQSKIGMEDSVETEEEETEENGRFTHQGHQSEVSIQSKKSRGLGHRLVKRMTQSNGYESHPQPDQNNNKKTSENCLVRLYNRFMEVIDYFRFIVNDSIGELVDTSYPPYSRRPVLIHGKETFQTDVDDYPLYSLHRVLGAIRRIVLIVSLVTISVLVPSYIVLSIFESSYEDTYAWELSALFLSGKASGIVLCIEFAAMICWFFYIFMKKILQVYHENAEEKNNRTMSSNSANSANSANTIPSSYASTMSPGFSVSRDSTMVNNHPMNEKPAESADSNGVVSSLDRLVSVMIGVFNFTIMVLIDIAYVVAILNEGGKTVLIVQISLSAFKLAWNETVLWRVYPICKRWVVKAFQPSLLQQPSEDGNERDSQQTSSASLYSMADAIQMHGPNSRSQSREASFVAGKGGTIEEEGDVNALVYTFSRYEVSYLVFTVIMNNIIIPCISIAIVSSDCYYNAFFADPPTEETSIYNCQLFGSLGPKKWCISSTVSTEDSTYNVPFIYRYQCSAAFITNFAPVHIFMFILIGLVLPITKICLKGVYDFTAPTGLEANAGTTMTSFRFSARSWLRRMISYLLPKSLLDLEPKKPRNTRTYVILDKDRLVVKLSAYMGIILAFGTLFPPLTVIACMSMYSMTYFEEILLGRLLFMAKQQGYHWYRVHLERNCQGVVTAWYGVVWLLLPFAALSFSYVVFDTLGDKYGWRAAIGPVLFVALLPFAIFLYRQIGVRLGLPMIVNTTFEKDVKGKTFSEVYQDVRSVSLSMIGPTPSLSVSPSFSHKKYDFGVNASSALAVDEGQGLDVAIGQRGSFGYANPGIFVAAPSRPTVYVPNSMNAESIRNPMATSNGDEHK